MPTISLLQRQNDLLSISLGADVQRLRPCASCFFRGCVILKLFGANVRLAKEFEVSETAMHHRLGEWPMKIYPRVEPSLHDGLTYLS